ncbi:alpha/beta fold hydrolase [Oculatella sp. LEGE 06141]|nr:alpha/beta fold hydrolase [Oculatella sp. LEGE 06141]MBE9179425.1 alpha/beta fold hydrolase [Oculatella sp. LEGE 06141]
MVSRLGVVVGLGLLLAVGAVNAVAFMQARAMTRFVAEGQRTAKPEQLSFVNKLGVMLTGVTVPRPEQGRSPHDVGMAYETHRIPVTEQEWIEAWWIPAPDSQGMVLLFPSYASSKDTLLEASGILHGLGYDTLLVDFRGVGGSSGSGTTLGIREGQDVAIAITYAQQQWSAHPIILYGISMGAVAVMRAIAHEQAVPDAIILESPFDRLLNTVRHRFESMGLPSFPGAELVTFWGGMQQQINGFAHNPLEYASAVHCPTLLMAGELDQRVLLSESETIVAAIAGEKQFVPFAAAGHSALVTSDAVQWKQSVQQFLTTLDFEPE